MLRDVFYFNKKPNAHPRERYALDLADARQQSTTEHFWVINEFCVYSNFDWEWDFELLSDEEVWTQEHNNVWPSLHQKDSGTWLCPSEESDITIYRADVEPLKRKNELHDAWVVHDLIDTALFDFGWHPDPTSPPYIYTWGNKWIAAEVQPTIEYHAPGATDRKYMDELIALRPQTDRWHRFDMIDDSFDFTWRPDPREPPFIYVWGNKWIAAEVQSTLEYRAPAATDRKYMDQLVLLQPESDRWYVFDLIDDSFDFSWRPDPREPPYIYVWGNKWVSAEVQSTLEYHAPGAIDRKYMDELVSVLPNEHWSELIPTINFDFSWRPDPREPPFIYVWGGKWVPPEVQPVVEYHVPGSTDRKYMLDAVDIQPDMSLWSITHPVSSFDFSWRPDPREPAFIYVFGNTQYPGTVMPTIRYCVPGATQEKHQTELVAKLAQRPELFENVVDNFDYSWRPDPTSPPYIYQFGTLLDENDGPRFVVPGNDGTVVKVNREDIVLEDIVFARYKIETTLEDLIQAHPSEIFWALNPDLDYSNFDFKWVPDAQNVYHINAFGSKDSINSQTYFVNGRMWARGYRDINYVEGKTVELKTVIDMFYVDRGNPESAERFEVLKQRYSNIQRTRYLNSWVDTIGRCTNRSASTLCWVLNSELDYSNFEFDYYPSPWQMRMVHVFGTQWSHWGTTFMVNKDSFADDTKYIKIIEHLSCLNFVRRKTAVATNRLYDIVVIDHGNKGSVRGDIHIKYEESYLNTFRELLKILPVKKEHYVWVCSSVCDYTGFDFSYICDPFAKDQLHVFPSDRQKFGDTFLVDVNKLRMLVDDMSQMEDYVKVNFNQHQRVKRLPPPVITVEEDTLSGKIQAEFDFPYAIFETEKLKVADQEPMNLWSAETKSIIITSTGGTRLVVPKEAKDYVVEELYDYPYITTATSLVNSAPLDIVYLSNGETGADENYEHLLTVTKGLPNRVVRVDGINGRVAAYHAALEASHTPWAFTVFAKLKVNSKFDWGWQPDRLQIPKHYIFSATNPVNGLEYGHQAMIAYNKKLVLGNTGVGLDFTLDNEHEVVELNSGVANFNTDPFSTWRTAFREAVKLRVSESEESKERLRIWKTTATGPYAEYCLAGVNQALEYYDEAGGDISELRLSYDWAWLHRRFKQLKLTDDKY